jgi:hypothetical protein
MKSPQNLRTPIRREWIAIFGGTPGVEREQNGNAGRASGLRQAVDVRRTNDGQSINN